jgi:uncharacterized membrane protein required for colicin V production
MYLNLLLLVIFACCVAFSVQNGLWGNALMLINAVMAALLAVNYFEPLAGWFESFNSSYTYLTDFLAMWLVFVVAITILRVLTDKLSTVKVKFRQPFDQIGGVLFGCWLGWVMVCFTLMSLHTAPLARNFLDGAFQPEPESRMFFGMAPDRQWLGFMQKSSVGAFSKRAPKGSPDLHKFDPHGEYVLKYAERRARFEDEPATRVQAK